ncbi:MAG: helix-turn-helix transcriptional regulator [Bacteroidetes bacterium]|nr:helix-turn-helix transcriptional regulator [Bacteroidota bacterium]
MNLGSKITELRKQKGWSQSELAQKLEVSREIVGRYERNDAVPSIEIAKRMADVFEVSLDYLVGSTEQEVDKATLNRLQEINRLSDENKKLVYTFLDSFITKTKLQGVL